MRDLHRLVVEVFQNPGYVAWYVVALTFLGFHLDFGFWSAFQSLGIYRPRLTWTLYAIGYFLAIAISVGYISIPASTWPNSLGLCGYVTKRSRS